MPEVAAPPDSPASSGTPSQPDMPEQAVPLDSPTPPGLAAPPDLPPPPETPSRPGMTERPAPPDLPTPPGWSAPPGLAPAAGDAVSAWHARTPRAAGLAHAAGSTPPVASPPYRSGPRGIGGAGASGGRWHPGGVCWAATSTGSAWPAEPHAGRGSCRMATPPTWARHCAPRT